MDQPDNLGGLSPNSPSVALCVASFADDDAKLRKNVPEDQVLDTTVTCDGTLARRGFQSLYGIVVVVSWKSGKVLDVKVLSKHCQAYATHHEMNTSSMKFWIGGKVTRLLER